MCYKFGSLCLIVVIIAIGLLAFINNTSIANINVAEGRGSEMKSNIITIENEYVSIAFDMHKGALHSLLNIKSGQEYLTREQPPLCIIHVDTEADSIWQATPKERVDMGSPKEWYLDKAVDAEKIIIKFYEKNYDIEVIATITLRDDQFIQWDFSVNNMGDAIIVKIDIPNIQIQKRAFPGDQLIWPRRRGQIIPWPSGRHEIIYPGVASMQWLHYGNDKEGLYMSVYDEEAAYKGLNYDGDNEGIRFWFSLWPFIPAESTSDLPSIELGVNQGDGWYWAGDRYRQWIIDEAQWTIEYPQWVEEMPGFGVSFVLDGDGRIVTPFSRIPAQAQNVIRGGGDILELKGWHPDGFDTYYPDYTPAEVAGGEGELAKAIATVAKDDIKVLFYMNSRIANRETEWYKEYGRENEALSVDGRPYDEHWNNYVFSAMSPAARGWQDILLTHQERLVNLGAKGIFFDQTGAMPAYLSYTPDHGHRNPATAFSEGHLQMFARFHKLWSTIDSYLFITEGVVDSLGSITHLHGLVWANHFNRYPWDAPQITRYVLPGKILGLYEADKNWNSQEAYYLAFILGSPFLGVPPATLRFQAIYEKEPDVFFRGRFMDERGVSYTHDQFQVGVHASNDGQRVVLILWNQAGGNILWRTRKVDINFDLEKVSNLSNTKSITIMDLETDENIEAKLFEGNLQISLDVKANNVRVLLIEAAD